MGVQNFVVWTKPGEEIRASINLTNQGFPVFLPLHEGRPLFPRYLFLEFDRSQPEWAKVRSTRGCIGLITNNHLPVPVPDEVIMALKSYRPPQEPAHGETVFTQGQTVRIVDGPLQGLEGLFVADRNKRVSCLLELLGRKVEVPRASVQAA